MLQMCPQLHRYGHLCKCGIILVMICRPSQAKFICTRPHHMHHVLGAKIAATHKRFAFSQWSASNDHYITWNNSSSPTLPTVNDIRCTIWWKLPLCADIAGIGCHVWIETDFKRASWSVQLLLCVGIAGIAGIAITSLHFAHVSMVLEWQLDIVYAAVLDCSHLLLIATTAFALQHVGSPHNAVHSSSFIFRAVHVHYSYTQLIL